LDTQLADLERDLVEALQPHEAALQLLMTMPGIDRLAAAKLLVEIGVDMAAFGNAGDWFSLIILQVIDFLIRCRK
jgi:transposase